jgi:gamma-glutamylcyclotransferase (GGCT)/AIG2-like uncharacterized protein YtfP
MDFMKDTNHDELRPVFVYGTLMSTRLLAGLLTGDERETGIVESMRESATLHGYSRRGVLGSDYPAVVETDPMDRVNGFMIHPRTLEDLKMLDDFENESYFRELVEVIDSVNQKTMAYVYVWCDDIDDLADSDWSLEEFEARWFR